MTNIAMTGSGKPGKRKTAPDGAGVTEKRVRGSDGQTYTLRTLHVESETFGDDLTYVFKKNVAKARRDNKRVTGVMDRAPVKA